AIAPVSVHRRSEEVGLPIDEKESAVMLEHEVDVAAKITGDLAEAESGHAIGVVERQGGRRISGKHGAERFGAQARSSALAAERKRELHLARTALERHVGQSQTEVSRTK